MKNNNRGAWLTRLIIFPVLLSLIITGCGRGGGGTPPKLTVESTSPADGDTGVSRDKEIRIVFSDELDTIQPDDVITVTDSNGQIITGHSIIDRRTLIFTPNRYPANETHLVTISQDVRGNNLTLEEAFEISFITGEKLTNGKFPPPDNYDPLGIGNQISLGKIPDVTIVWSDNTDTRMVVEDPPYNPSPMTNPQSPDATTISNTAEYSSLNQLKFPVSGQFDDDKWDETAVFSHDGTGGGAISLTIIDTIADNEFIEKTLDLSFGSADSLDTASADFDADGRDEILIATSSRSRATIDFYLVGYDSSSKSYQIIKQGSVDPGTTDVIVNIKVAAGDVDADRKAEAVFSWVQDTGVRVNYFGFPFQRKANKAESYYVVYDDPGAGMTEMSPIQSVTTVMHLWDDCPHDYVDVTTGDIDGDGAEEVMIGATLFVDTGRSGTYLNPYNIDYRQCTIHDSLFVAQNTHADAESRTLALNLLGSYEHISLGDITFRKGDGLMPILQTADLDGDLRVELLFHNRILGFDKDKDVKSTATPVLKLALPIPETQLSMFSSHWDGLDYVFNHAHDLTTGYLTTDIQVGDIDGDLKDDLVLLRRADGTTTHDSYGSLLPAGVWLEHFDFADCLKESSETYCAGFDPENPDLRLAWKKFKLQGSDTYSAIGGIPRLSLANVDSDSLIVEPLDHTIYTSNNTIIALLAAPPCSEDIGQDTGDCSTEFGHGSTHSWEDGVYVNASVGIVAGFEWEPEVNIPFMKIKLAKIEVEASAGVEGGYQHNWGLETSELITYSAGAKNNLVVFESYVYDRYQYKVLSHPDSNLIGTHINVSLPTGKKLFAVGQEYYNATNGTQIDIDDAIISVVPGDLDTYPDRSQAEIIVTETNNKPVAMSDSHTQIPGGETNAVSLEASVSTSESDEFSVGAYVTASAKVCGPDASGINPSVCLGVEASGSTGYAHSHTWSTDMIFTGTVTGVPLDRYAEEAFGLGLFAYKTSINDNVSGEQQQFIVINYFLDR